MKWIIKYWMNRGANVRYTLLPESWCLLVLFRHAECMSDPLVHGLNRPSCASSQVGGIHFGSRKRRCLIASQALNAVAFSSVVLCSHEERCSTKTSSYMILWRAWGFAVGNIIKGFQQGHSKAHGISDGAAKRIDPSQPQREMMWIHRANLGDIPAQSTILEQVFCTEEGSMDWALHGANILILCLFSFVISLHFDCYIGAGILFCTYFIHAV